MKVLVVAPELVLARLCMPVPSWQVSRALTLVADRQVLWSALVATSPLSPPRPLQRCHAGKRAAQRHPALATTVPVATMLTRCSSNGGSPGHNCSSRPGRRRACSRVWVPRALALLLQQKVGAAEPEEG